MTLIASKNKNNLIELVKTPFSHILQSSFSTNDNGNKRENDIINWIYLKLNILLNNQFNGDLYAEEDTKISGLLIDKKYDIVIKSKSLNKTVLVVSLHKIINNLNNSFYSTYKDIIFNTVNLGAKNIPYYSLFFVPVKNRNDKGQLETFSNTNLLRIYNGNKSSHVSGVTKIMLLDVDNNGNTLEPIVDTNTILSDSNIANSLNAGVILPNIKNLFVDIYNILQKTY